jgi:hypothetical protein
MRSARGRRRAREARRSGRSGGGAERVSGSARRQPASAKLRQARLAAGLTQAAVATHFRRPQSFVSKCESGERRIDPTELQVLARHYKKPLAFFLDDD